MINQLVYFASTCPSITVPNDTVTDDSTATVMCLSSICDISVSFDYEWTVPNHLVISVETDGILIISTVGVDDAGHVYIYC